MCVNDNPLLKLDEMRQLWNRQNVLLEEMRDLIKNTSLLEARTALSSVMASLYKEQNRLKEMIDFGDQMVQWFNKIEYPEC